MKITLTLNSGDVRRVKPCPSRTKGHASGVCPSCKGNGPDGESFPVAGTGKSIDPDRRHDTYRAEAICLLCEAHVGILRAKVDTLFGIEEDEALSHYTTIRGIKVY